MQLVKEVLRSTKLVAAEAQQVTISEAGVARLASSMRQSGLQRLTSPAAYDTEVHYFDNGPRTLQYLLVVDALNFCFWPDSSLEYEQLAKGVKAAAQHAPDTLEAARLAEASEADVQALIGRQHPLPLQAERARLLREVGRGLQQHFAGQAADLVAAADRSAVSLVDSMTATFPGFRDHCIYRGRQVHLLKRAQIFVADVWGAFQGKGLGEFHDIDQLTMFADYRVPAVLREFGVLQYSQKLAAQIDDKLEIAAGSAAECEIRACTIQAVEQLKAALSDAELGPCSIQLDWWLWEHGEKNRRVHAPHHRTLTIFY